MTRAQSLSLVFVTVGVMLLFERKYRWLALAAFAYVWAYNLFVLLAVLAFLWAIAGWWTERRFEWTPIGWTAAGIVAGFVANPYFPRNARLFWENLAGKTALPAGAGSEWYALPSWLLLKSSFIAFAAMLIGYLAFGYLLNDAAFGLPRASVPVSGRSVGTSRLRRPLFFLLVATLLLILTARSKRFAEYWPPCAVLFAAFTLQAVWDRQSETGRDTPATPDRRLKTAALVVLLGGSAYALWMAGQTMNTRVSLDQYRGGAEWLRAHAPAGETVFNVSWDDFPKLYYYDPSRPYVAGLDPLYLSNADPELGRLYERIATGKEENPGSMIRARFGAQYVFAGKPLDRAFYLRAMFSDQFDKVYEDPQCLILKVKE
jgi:hypothetical protein